MKQTANYQLTQWEQTDRIQMEDFNADNQKTEQALSALAEGQSQAAAELAKRGNCSIGLFTYTGTGTSGSANPTTITFPRKPTAFILKSGYSSQNHGFLMLWTELDTDTTFILVNAGSGIGLSYLNIQWSGDQARFWTTQIQGASILQGNESGVVYQVIAFYAEA